MYVWIWYLHASVQVPMVTNTKKPEQTLSDFLHHSLPYCLERGCLTEQKLILAGLASWPVSPWYLPVSFPLMLPPAMSSPTELFYMGGGDLNSGLHICKASIPNHCINFTLAKLTKQNTQCDTVTAKTVSTLNSTNSKPSYILADK